MSWYLDPREKLLKRIFVVATSMYSFSVLAFLFQRVDFTRTPKGPRTSNVDVSFLLKIWELEMAQHGHAVIVWIVVVPLIAVRMDEEDVVGESVVVVYDVAIPHPGSAGVCQREGRESTNVKYTMLSLPLFLGTVSGAWGSSTR